MFPGINFWHFPLALKTTNVPFVHVKLHMSPMSTKSDHKQEGYSAVSSIYTWHDTRSNQITLDSQNASTLGWLKLNPEARMNKIHLLKMWVRMSDTAETFMMVLKFKRDTKSHRWRPTEKEVKQHVCSVVPLHNSHLDRSSSYFLITKHKYCMG